MVPQHPDSAAQSLIDPRRMSRFMRSLVSFMAVSAVLAALVRVVAVADQPVVPLWPADALGDQGGRGEEQVRLTDSGERIVANVHQPSLTVYLPKTRTRPSPAIVVMPGGGHRELWMDHEGYRVGEWLAERGIAAFVLKYRLAGSPGSTYRVERESLQDGQRAVQLVRSRAAEWQIDPARVGVIGFSAGGQLAGLVAQRSDAARAEASDSVARESSRPAFQALVYPGGIGSFEPDASSPPAFLLCGAEDHLGIAEGVAQLYLAFQHAKVPVELHVYAHAGHGFGIRPTNRTASAGWPERLLEWMRDSRWITE